MILNQPFYDAIIEKILGFLIPFIDKMLTVANGRIDFFRTGDDYGTQRGLLMSRQQWRNHVQSGLAAISDVAKRHGTYHYHHSCGGIRELIDDFIETGIDVIDPVQVKAKGMIPRELKAEFGDKMCFSGGVDEQELLPTTKIR